MMPVDRRISGVVKLARNKDLWVIFCHFVRNSLAFRNTVADIARVMYQNDFSAIVLHQLAALL